MMARSPLAAGDGSGGNALFGHYPGDALDFWRVETCIAEIAQMSPKNYGFLDRLSR
jgi:hypothetical protein